MSESFLKCGSKWITAPPSGQSSVKQHHVSLKLQLSSTTATSHTWLLITWNVARQEANPGREWGPGSDAAFSSAGEHLDAPGRTDPASASQDCKFQLFLCSLKCPWRKHYPCWHQFSLLSNGKYLTSWSQNPVRAKCPIISVVSSIHSWPSERGTCKEVPGFWLITGSHHFLGAQGPWGDTHAVSQHSSLFTGRCHSST